MKLPKKGVKVTLGTKTFVMFVYFRYLGDGRFHLESVMISNPDVAAYRSEAWTFRNLRLN